MSVLTQIGVEIDRIETAKASIKAAIEGKGVSVPSDTKIDGMSGYIDAIDTSEDLDTVLARQDTLIEDIKTALEGKAAGGTSVETCTINVTNTISPARYGQIYDWCATCFDATTGEFTYSGNNTGGALTQFTLSNVVCGSIFTVLGEGMYFLPNSLGVSGDGDFEVMHSLDGSTQVISSSYMLPIRAPKSPCVLNLTISA